MTKGLGQLTPDEMAARCARLGARVDQRGHRWLIYPPDPDARVLAFSALHMQGNHQANVVSDLRKAGLDVLSAEATGKVPKPAPPTVPPSPTEKAEPVNETPKPGPPASTEAWRKAIAEVRDQCRQLSDTTVKMLAEQETALAKANARIAELEERLDVVAPKPMPKPPTTAEICQAAIMGWFEAMPRGFKASPSTVEANLVDRLPESRVKTAVAHACRELVLAGRLSGGGRVGQSAHGLYWMDADQGDDPSAPAGRLDPED